MRSLQRLLPRDPRLLQIAFLASFLALGVAFLGLQVEPWMPPVLLVSTCAVQWACERLLRLPSSGFRSPLITGLGLSLLLRTDALWVPPLAAAIGIGAKYLVRVRGKHLFNPGMLGLTSCILLTGHAWCSPSQWGEGMALLAWFAVLGLAVVSRSFRADVSLAFLGSWVLLKLARVLWLGQRPAVLGHQLLVGSLILFTFFMVSDPKTTPDRRSARIGYGIAVAVLAFVLQHQAWVMNAPVWALLLLSPVVPLLDRLFPASRFTWPSGQLSPQGVTAVPAPAVRRVAPLLVLPLLVLLHPSPASAFCGFYVGKADTQLFNESSQVALVRDGDRTVLTMSNDYRGPLTEFALVVPVPTVLEREQIHVGERRLLEHLDAYSAPRLVEYFDPDPCARMYPMSKAAGAPAMDMASRSVAEKKREEALGVRDRGQVHRGRVRHPHPRGEAVRGAGDVAPRERLPHPGEGSRRAPAVHPPGHEVLRGQGESGGPEGQRGAVPPAAADRLRVEEVHAPHPPGDGERRRTAGPHRLRADPPGPGRVDQLPDHAAFPRI